MQRLRASLGVLVAMSLIFGACDEEAPDKIIFGQTCSKSGD